MDNEKKDNEEKENLCILDKKNCNCEKITYPINKSILILLVKNLIYIKSYYILYIYLQKNN